jgi:hypothetical protein
VVSQNAKGFKFSSPIKFLGSQTYTLRAFIFWKKDKLNIIPFMSPHVYSATYVWEKQAVYAALQVIYLTWETNNHQHTKILDEVHDRLLDTKRDSPKICLHFNMAVAWQHHTKQMTSETSSVRTCGWFPWNWYECVMDPNYSRILSWQKNKCSRFPFYTYWVNTE